MSTQPSPQAFRETVRCMDQLSQAAFETIAAIASLALGRLETPAGCRNLDQLAIALTAIVDAASHAENSINVTAEGVGCNYINEAQRRRWQAQRLAEEAA